MSLPRSLQQRSGTILTPSIISDESAREAMKDASKADNWSEGIIGREVNAVAGGSDNTTGVQIVAGGSNVSQLGMTRVVGKHSPAWEYVYRISPPRLMRHGKYACHESKLYHDATQDDRSMKSARKMFQCLEGF